MPTEQQHLEDVQTAAKLEDAKAKQLAQKAQRKGQRR